MVGEITRQKPVQIPDGDPRVGIFGGQGPGAGADAAAIFQNVQGTKETEQEYVAAVLLNDPKIPDRTAYIKDKTKKDPFPLMKSLIGELDAFKRVSVIFTPCNTAHSSGWHRRLAKTVDAVLLNMPRATVKQLLESGVPKGSKIGVMCTDGTKSQGLYDKALAKGNYKPVYPNAEQQKDVMDGIYKGVKLNNVAEGTRLMQPVLEALLAQGCHTVLLACTEIPMALPNAAQTLNPVEAAAKRSLHHIDGIKAARARGETIYDAGSDADLSDSESEAEPAPAAPAPRRYGQTSSQQATTGGQSLPARPAPAVDTARIAARAAVGAPSQTPSGQTERRPLRRVPARQELRSSKDTGQ